MTERKEQYAFEDYLHSNMTREGAEHDYRSKKPKPTYNKEYNPDKSKIDFLWKTCDGSK